MVWFSQATIFNFSHSTPVDFKDKLENLALKACLPHAKMSSGWLPLDVEKFHQSIASISLLHFGIEEKILPRAVITHQLKERITALETQQQRKISRNEKTQLIETLEFELLPQAFVVQKRIPVLMDQLSHQIIIQSTTPATVDLVTKLLRQTLPELQLTPIKTKDSLAHQFTQWLTHPETLPKGLALAQDCLLFSPKDEKKRFYCRGYELLSEEVQTLLSQGLWSAELTLTWHDRLQFSINQDFALKKIKPLEYLSDQINEIHAEAEDAAAGEASLLLVAGELRGVLNDLLSALTEKTSHQLNDKIAMETN